MIRKSFVSPHETNTESAVAFFALGWLADTGWNPVGGRAG